LALTAPFLADARIGIKVVDLDTGKTLYDQGGSRPLNPASNVKLITTAAALMVLGPEYRYPTRVYFKGDTLAGSVIKGDLYLRGSGDPDLVTEDLGALASELHARGIRRVTGGIVVDSTRFDQDRLPPGFDQKEELASYRAPSGATSVNFNTFVVRVQPGGNLGDPVAAGTDPPVAGLELVNEATTDAGWRDRLLASVEYGKTTKIALRGTLGVDSGAKAYRYPVTDPSQYAGEVFALALAQHGIRVARSRIKSAPIPKDAKLLASHFSAPLSVLIRAVNKYSNNFMAEQILKTIAPPATPASFAAALDRVRRHMEEAGIDTNGVKLGNGSGLYDTNRLTATTVTDVLAHMYADFRYRSDYLSSMAVMGVDGTVRSRLRETTAQRWVRAKTGTLDGVSALSGYAAAPGRDPIAFSLLFNGLARGDTAKARDIQNRVAEVVARYAAGQSLVDPLPALASD
jgi:D-alanyl-D-alanine carboxypeptidase/D-alanyl-D-alanine-endopeptidase (penicillin-binding protein 4)